MIITVIGVGGAGNNMVNYLSLSESIGTDVKLYNINTDSQVLKKQKKIEIIQLGDGLGAGMKPEIGLQAAIESEEEIKNILIGSDIVLIAAGMGGGTGTGAAPYIASLSKDLNILTIAIVTTPFVFEGKNRSKIANFGLDRLKKSTNAIVVIENNKILSLIDKKAGLKESFLKVDQILANAISAITGILLPDGSSDINVDFADFKTIFSHTGDCILTIGESVVSVEDAIKNALNSPLIKNSKIEKSSGLIIHFEINPDFPFLDLSISMQDLHDFLENEDAEVIFGTSINNNFDINQIKVTIIAAGLNEKINNKQRKVFKISA